MDWILVHAGHLVPLIGLGGWLGWARLARSRAARAAGGAAPAGAAGTNGGAGPARPTAAPAVVSGSAAASGPAGVAVPPAGGVLDVSLDWRLLLMACSVGAALVHADVIQSHFQVGPLYGWFFVLSAVTQLAWGLLVVWRPDHALLVLGAVGNALIVLLWAVTRTFGLPLGPQPWQPETTGAFDLLATALEVALVAGAVALLTGTGGVTDSRRKLNSRGTSHMLVNLPTAPAPTQNSPSQIGGLRRSEVQRHAALDGIDGGRRAGRSSESGGVRPTVTWILEYLPRGNLLNPEEWRRRHSFLQWILLIHLLGLFIFGLALHHPALTVALGLIPLVVCLVAGRVVSHRRLASLSITAGLVYSSIALVVFSRGSIEAHFHFFVIIGFIALYQDWVPFLWNAAFTSLSHGVGTLINREWIFNHQAGQNSPWVWSTIHGIAVLAACIGVVVFWKNNEDEQAKSLGLMRRLADAEIGRRKFTSDMLVNLARRNQSLLYRQLGIINQLEEQERDPDALAELFRLDHLATRIRRNAESLLVLSGEGPPRTWSEPVLLVDVVRAAIAETEDLDRVAFFLDERLAVMGHTVTDLTHLLAELVENAVRFSPPEASVIIRLRPHPSTHGAQLLTIEDCGIGMRREDLDAANDLLAHPQEVDLSVSQRLGLHVVARLAERHGIDVSLTLTPGSGITAVVVLPERLFSDLPVEAPAAVGSQHAKPMAAVAAPAQPAPAPSEHRTGNGHGNGNGGARRSLEGHGGAAQPADFGLGEVEPWWGWWEPVVEPEPPGNEPPGNGGSRVTVADAPAERPAEPAAPTPMAAPPGPPPRAAAPGEPGLARRVPQSHLAPELRQRSPSAGPDEQERSVPNGERTREALSRYQASRQAARALVEREEIDLGAQPPDADTAPPDGSGGGRP
jgi:signal transduction histidine kinase